MAIIKVKTGGITADAITDALIADDVVGTEHLTANEVDTTALGADAVTGAQLADNAVNSEHYTDGSVDTAHIADAQITTAKLSTAVFTGATDIGAAIADADLILLDDGAGGTIRKSTASRIKTYVGANTPRISVDKTGSSQSISATSWTKVTLNTERVDSDNAFTSNTFTVPSGKGGDYYMSAFATVTSLNGTSDYASLRLANSGNSTIYNGAAVSGNSGYGWFTMSISCIRTLSAGDTVSLYVYSSEAISVNEDNANLTVIKLI
jgi:hypothetical protein